MPRDAKPLSLHPLTPADALAALLRVPPPPKTAKPAKAKRRAPKRTKKRPKS
jgi:hypothetical protein